MGNDFCSTSRYHAFRRRKCYWCNAFIEEKELYIRFSGVWEGDFFSSSYHKECYGARDVWYQENRGEDYDPEEGSMKRGEDSEKE
jgi:hypothetical protein